MEKTIAILGATGSVGTQTLGVARARGYKVDFLSAGKNYKAAERACREFGPSVVAMADENAARELRVCLADTDIKVLSGKGGIEEGIHSSESDTVVNSILGCAGLLPSLAVIDAKKRLALANKESLVVAGDIVMNRAREASVEIIPVDSEHSAIFQSLKSGRSSELSRIILTASGGPFFGYTRDQLERVTKADTLRHPTWKMGEKITVDSATLMNKGFEIIEAAHLFDVSADKISVVVHRESILHSAVEYIDKSIIGEFSVPDMRMCIQYAVDYPERAAGESETLDFAKIGKLTFFEPDTEAFPLLSLAGRCVKAGGALPAVLNAADEVAVEAFLGETLSFVGISDVVERVCRALESSAVKETTLEGILALDKEARALASSYLKR